LKESAVLFQARALDTNLKKRIERNHEQSLDGVEIVGISKRELKAFKEI